MKYRFIHDAERRYSINDGNYMLSGGGGNVAGGMGMFSRENWLERLVNALRMVVAGALVKSGPAPLSL